MAFPQVKLTAIRAKFNVVFNIRQVAQRNLRTRPTRRLGEEHGSSNAKLQ